MERGNRILVAAAVAIGVVAVGACAAGAEAAEQLTLTVKVAAAGGKDVPLCANIDLPAALAKLPAEKQWRRLNGSALLPEVIPGVRFVDGVKELAA